MTVFDTQLAPVMPILQQIEAGRKKHHNEEFLWIDFGDWLTNLTNLDDSPLASRYSRLSP